MPSRALSFSVSICDIPVSQAELLDNLPGHNSCLWSLCRIYRDVRRCVPVQAGILLATVSDILQVRQAVMGLRACSRSSTSRNSLAYVLHLVSSQGSTVMRRRGCRRLWQQPQQEHKTAQS